MRFLTGIVAGSRSRRVFFLVVVLSRLVCGVVSVIRARLY
jgi:hypothetical protein